MVTDKNLLKEITKELWHSVKKLRPELDKEPRMQLVLKALITIADHPNPIEAAMVVAVCLEMEEQKESPVKEKNKTSTEKNEKEESPEALENKRTVRRRSAAN